MNERKQILVADADPRAGGEFNSALGEEWEILWASSGASALALLEDNPCQVVVANIDLPELDGAELLNRVRRKYPRTIRFMAARDEDKQRVIKAARGAHQFLSKPYDTAALKDSVERALALDVWISSDRIREAVARIRTLPTVPTLYTEIIAALRSENVSTEEVGAIIAKDMAMTTRMLQLLNSACFGLTRQITDPADAVGILGFETVKTMVMTIKLLNQYDKLKAADFSMDRLWKHSTAVGSTARQITLVETGDRGLADAAFTAGLLHDVGKVVLAANFEDKYSGALLLGFKQHLTAWDVEKEIFGANHGEIGAYLLGLWGLPLKLVEATALHHEPARSENLEFSVLTAVHVANVLEREVNKDELGMIPPVLDTVYLENLGLHNRVKSWRAAIAVLNQPKPEPKPQARMTSRTGRTDISRPQPAIPQINTWPAPVPVPVPAPVAVESKPAPKPVVTIHAPAGNSPAWEEAFSKVKWLFFGAGGATLVFLLIWVFAGRSGSHASAVGTTNVTSGDVAAVSNKVPSLGVTRPLASKVDSHGQASNALPTKLPSGSKGILDPSPLLVRARTSTNEPGDAPPVPFDFSQYKLQGIFYSTGDPTAIINGKTVRQKDHLDEVLVVSITPSTVVLDAHNQRKTLAIK